MYTQFNYQTKKALKDAVRGSIVECNGVPVRVKAVGMFDRHSETWTGPAVIEGPQYPAPHRWYARVACVEGVIVKVIG